MTDDQNPFICPRCGHSDRIFHQICPNCGRPCFRDYIDGRMYPRDPNPQCIYKGKFWARVFLALSLLGLAILAISILMSFYII